MVELEFAIVGFLGEWKTGEPEENLSEQRIEPRAISALGQQQAQ